MAFLAFLDVQHAGRPSRPGDLGAQGREVPAVRQYVAACRAALEAAGVRVVVLEAGEYAARHAAVCEMARTERPDRAAYLACHLNAGGGDYGLVLHDARSRAGKVLAETVAWEMGAGLCPPLRRVVTSWTSSEASAPYPRAWGCLRGVWQGPACLTGALVEPAFLDRPEHAALLEPAGLVTVGRTLARGVLAYLTGGAP